jgi:hypothetical protein
MLVPHYALRHCRDGALCALPCPAGARCARDAAKLGVKAPAPRPAPCNTAQPGPSAKAGHALDAAAVTAYGIDRLGYTGQPCDACGSWRTRRAGKCITCEACGAAGECG